MEQVDQIRKNRMMLLLIAGIPVTMILAASWLWYFVVRGELDLVGTLGTANRGSLVRPPRQLDDVELRDDQGYVFRYGDMEPRWTMLVPNAGAECADSCERSLYLTRQIHVAMGKGFSRLRRLYVGDVAAADTRLSVASLSDEHPAPPTVADLLQGEHRGVNSLAASPALLQPLFREYLEDPSTWYLVDPAGWVMMSYNDEVPYKDVIADLKFLLKNSSE